jgi:hypothetical protein
LIWSPRKVKCASLRCVTLSDSDSASHSGPRSSEIAGKCHRRQIQSGLLVLKANLFILLAQYKLNRLARLSRPPLPRQISPRELSLFCRINCYPFYEPDTNALNSEDPTSLSTIEAYQNVLESSYPWIGMSDHHT